VLLEDSDIKRAVAAALKKDVADLPDYFDEYVANAHLSGWADVREAMLRRGFSQAQILAWPRCAEYERKQSLFHALINGGGLESFDLTGVRVLDQRKELASMQMYDDDGNYITPANGAAGPGTVNTGGPSGGYSDTQFPPSGFDW
jgi:hypothetical protein